MSTSEKNLQDALDAAAGRRDAQGIAPDLLAWAEAVRATRRRLATAEPCPTAFLARARSILTDRETSTGFGRRLRLVFDSWLDVAPAFRGAAAARLLRFEDDDHAIDLRIARGADGAWILHVAAEPEQPDLVATIALAGQDDAVTGPLDERGAGRLCLPGATRSIVVTIGTTEAPLLRSESIDLESR